MLTTNQEVAVVFPAYNEEGNLYTSVTTTVDYLTGKVHDYRIIIVNDGSSDRTGEIAATLAADDPKRILVVTHPRNQGYGAAVRSGLTAAYQSELEWIFLTDADGQFDIAELPNLFDAAQKHGAALVTGWRTHRADPLIRRINGRLWSGATCLLLGFRVHDVDCAFKLIHRRVLETITLTGESAVISPELLAKTVRAGFDVAEVEVHHYPRLLGKQTGASLPVILRSFAGLLKLRLNLAITTHQGSYRSAVH